MSEIMTGRTDPSKAGDSHQLAVAYPHDIGGMGSVLHPIVMNLGIAL